MNRDKFYFNQCLAELLGTFFMIFFGCGSMVLAQVNSNSINPTAIPIIWGGIVSIMVYTLGHLSGAHFNPAVSLSFAFLGQIKLFKLLLFVLSQLLGALLACFVLFLIFDNQNHDFGMTQAISTKILIITEFIMSFMLMFVITSVATDSRAKGQMAGLAIGGTIALCAFVAGPLTKASMNPVRSLAPAIFVGNFSQIIYYLLIPFVGAVSGAFSYRFIKCQVGDKDNCC